MRACVRARLDDKLPSWKNNQTGREIRSRAHDRSRIRDRSPIVGRSGGVRKKILFIDAWSVVDGQARTRETLIRRESNVTIDTRHLLPARCSPLCVTRIYRPPSHTIKGKNGKFFTNIVNNDRTLVVPRMQRDRIASLFSSFLRIRSSIDSQLPVSSIVNGGESISR